MSSSKRGDNNRKRQRTVGRFVPIEKKFYIFCEGERTEPNYFQGFAQAIKTEPIYKNAVHIEVEGVGAETLRVIYAAEKYVENNGIEDAEIWCVYDLDSFPKDSFNNVASYAAALNAKEAKKRSGRVTYNVAWSNQCIEYWFILHFNYYDADNERTEYIKFLNREFRKIGVGKYEKNDPQIFGTLTFQGNPKQAIRWAEKRRKECKG